MSLSADDCVHLSVDIVKQIQQAVIEEFGGPLGVRDEDLLSSAVGATQATIGGHSPFADAIEIAAAYLYYLCRNHPFVDGNKRTAMAAAIVFLRLNGIEPAPDQPAWESLVMDVAASRLDRDAATVRLRRLAARKRKR